MTTQGGSNHKATFARLPTNVVPNHYMITIRPDLNKFTFSGHETVDVHVNERTKTIVINALDIDVQSASFVANNQEYKSVAIELNKSEEVVIITFDNQIEVGAGQLKLQFTGAINNLMIGCYRCKYITPAGEVRYGLSTKFESVHCRRAFPCWDEPALKAKFDLSLVVPKDRMALSNMDPVEETEDDADSTKRIVKFETTPIMSTYLLCYVIGEYESISQKTKNGTLMRVFTQLNKTDQAQFVLKLTVRCLEFYEEYFKIAYPLPKLDQIAIPDFQIGGMENWGLITYRESCVLYDPQNSSESTKKFIAIVACHELAHMWFGNLTTMSWWSDLWLKEGFATFMASYAVDHLLPELNIWQQFITDSMCIAFGLDAMHNSHPIEAAVERAGDIEEIFDRISYEKGSTIIRMLYNYIGGDSFRNGIHHYLNKWAYKNTVTDDLWDSLEEASKKPVRSIMSTWTRQMGYPLISVAARQDGLNRVITLSQEKFSIDGVLSEKDRQSKWLVPISIISRSNPKSHKILLEDRNDEIVLENVDPSEWIKLNPEMTSFYRVNYSTELLEKLFPSIVDKSLAPIDRLNIVSDLFALVLCGKASSDSILKLMESYVNEDNHVVWDLIVSCLSKFNKLLAYTDFQEVFHVYVRKLLAKIHTKLGNKPISSEDHQNAMLRTTILSLLVSCKDLQVLQEAKRQFEAHVSKVGQISPDLRAPVYRAVAYDCDDKTFEMFFQLYRESDLNEEKNRIIRSMGATNDPSRIQKIIDFAMSEVRSQDTVMVFAAIAANSKVGRDLAWNYFKENHRVFTKKYRSGQLLARLVEGLPNNFASEERLQEVAEFFSTNQIPSTERTVKQVLESIKLNADWLSRDKLVIKNYLTSQL